MCTLCEGLFEMGREEEIRKRLAELDVELPAENAVQRALNAEAKAHAKVLHGLVDEQVALLAELTVLRKKAKRDRFRVINGGKIGVAALPLLGLARRHPAAVVLTSAGAVAAAGLTTAVLTFTPPRVAHESGTRAVAPTVAVTAAPGGGSSSGVSPSRAVASPGVSRAPVAASATHPVASASAGSSGPSARVSAPAVAVSVPVPVSLSPSVPAVPSVPTTPTILAALPPRPSPAGTCLIVVDLKPVLGACVR
jgi:hypothetical protein